MTNDQRSIVSMLQSYGAALNRSDAATAVSLYTSDGVFMPSGGPSAKGSDDLLASYRYIFSQIRLDIEFEIHEIVVDGDHAYAVTSSEGRQTIVATGSTEHEANRELFVLKRQSEGWKISRYMFNKA